MTMPAKHPYAWMAAIGIVTAALLGHEMRQRQDVERLMGSASRLLDAPLHKAPELQDIQASRARAFLEGALAIRESSDTRGMRDYARALEEYQKENLEAARTHLKKAETELGATVRVQVLSAAIDVQAGNLDAAQQALDAAPAAHAEDARAMMLRVDLALDAEDGDGAVELCDRTLKLQPRAASALNRRGLARELLGDPRAARKDYEAAAGLDERLPHAHLNLGRMLRQQGEDKEALLAFAEAARRAPQQSLAWLGLGLSRIAVGDPIGARVDLERARAIASQEPEPLLALADLDLAEGQRDRAVVRYRAAVTLAPEHAGGWVKLGNALVRSGQPTDARDAFDRAIEESPKLAAAHNGRGAVLAILGQPELAAMALATAASLDDADPNPLLNLARLRMKTGDLEGAKQAQLRAIERDPSVTPLL